MREIRFRSQPATRNQQFATALDKKIADDRNAKANRRNEIVLATRRSHQEIRGFPSPPHDGFGFVDDLWITVST
jgi:hypothetical protein